MEREGLLPVTRLLGEARAGNIKTWDPFELLKCLRIGANHHFLSASSPHSTTSATLETGSCLCSVPIGYAQQMHASGTTPSVDVYCTYLWGFPYCTTGQRGQKGRKRW